MEKYLIISILLAATIFLIVESYPTISDAEVDKILQNNHLLNNYIHCALAKCSCSLYGRLLKKFVNEIMNTNCSSCSNHQKHLIGKIINYLKANKWEDWNQIVAKYAPRSEQKRYIEEWSRRA